MRRAGWSSLETCTMGRHLLYFKSCFKLHTVVQMSDRLERWKYIVVDALFSTSVYFLFSLKRLIQFHTPLRFCAKKTFENKCLYATHSHLNAPQVWQSGVCTFINVWFVQASAPRHSKPLPDEQAGEDERSLDLVTLLLNVKG